MTCRHRQRSGYESPIRYSHKPIVMPSGSHAFVKELQCVRCGKRFGMGPSNDTPEALVEIRAAEVAAAITIGPNGNAYFNAMPYGAWCGWMYSRQDAPGVEHSEMYLAGYLARVIATHGGEA